MFQQQTEVLDVPSASGVILEDFSTNGGGSRTLLLQNLTETTLALQIEACADGTTWTVVGQSFNLTSKAVLAKVVDTNNPIRLKGSGGAGSKELLASMIRVMPQPETVRLTQGLI